MVTMMNTIDEMIRLAFDEDCPNGDISAIDAFPKTHCSTARIIAKESGIFYGKELSQTMVDYIEKLELNLNLDDGDAFQTGDILMTIEGATLALLRLERVLLNFLQRLCGVSSITNHYVNALNNPNIHILDTRKTTPLFRSLEKAAVVAGGGYNHRFSLSDMVLLKENHINAICQSGGMAGLRRFLQTTRQTQKCPIEIEIETLDQLRTFPLDLVDIIMFDNMSLEDTKEGIAICKSRGLSAEIELSGNIDLETISQYSELDIQRISIGRLTHSVKAIDLSLLLDDLIS